MKALAVALWITQGLLALAFGFAGFMKLTRPFAELAAAMPWTEVVGPALTRFIGASELAGALGLILPAVTRIKPNLTPLAAIGLATIMLLAMLFHVSRGEPPFANLLLGGLAAFVAWGRFRRAPILARA